MTQALFRTEVLKKRAEGAQGQIILAQPIPMRVAAIVSVLLSSALMLVLFFGEYVRKISVAGEIVPAAGLLTISTPQPGRIVSSNSSEGTLVKKGQILFEVSSERASKDHGIDAKIDDALRSRRELILLESNLRQNQLDQQLKSLGTRAKLVEAEIARYSTEIEIQKQRSLAVDSTQKRYEALRTQGFVSELQLNEVSNARHDQQSRLQSLERNKLTAQGELEQLQHDQQQAIGLLRVGAAQTAQSLAILSQEAAEHEGRARAQIVAPMEGIVTSLKAEVGQSMQAGDRLANILPIGSDLEAHLFAPSRAIGFVKAGQIVKLRIAAFPYQKFGQIAGQVIRIEKSPTIEKRGVAIGQAESTYRIVVKLERQSILANGSVFPFVPGMTLEGDIRQDKRRLIEWAVDPFFSLAKEHAG